MPIRVNIQGESLAPEQAKVSVFDRGFLFGDAVFETCRTYGGKPFLLGPHLRRLRRSAATLGISLPEDQTIVNEVERTLAEANNPESVIRTIFTRGVGPAMGLDPLGCDEPLMVIIVRPFEPLAAQLVEEGAEIVIPTVRRIGPRALPGWVKTGNYLNQIQALSEGKRKGAYEVVMLDEAGFVAEGSTSNVFFVRGEVLCTPSVDVGILPGLTRAVVLGLARQAGIPTRMGMFRPADLLGAEEAFITSTLKEILPVCSVDGSNMPGIPGPVTALLMARFRQLTGRFERDQMQDNDWNELLGDDEVPREVS